MRKTAMPSIRTLMIFAAALGLFFAAGAQRFADDQILPPPKIIEESVDNPPPFLPILIKDHRFNPDKITLLPQEKVILRVVNQDESAEEFYSRYLKRQKIVPG